MQDRATTKCVLAAFRYLVTGIVALLLVLLLVELGAAIGAAVERGQEDLPAPAISEDLSRTQARK